MYVRSFWANTKTHWLRLHEVKKGGKKTRMSTVIPWKKSSGIWVFRAQNKGHKHNRKGWGCCFEQREEWAGYWVWPPRLIWPPNASALRTIHQRFPHKDGLLYCFHLSHQKHDHTSGSSKDPGEMWMCDDLKQITNEMLQFRLNRGNTDLKSLWKASLFFRTK